MAEVKWTDAQEKAIQKSGKNILVSAAAGSGKTAVLTERVMKMLREGVDVDSLLIMTFTKAAAAQMKEKIYRKIRKEIDADPSNEHMRRQLYRVHNARIYTIDALCMQIVRDNFQELDVDPGFRIADESELKMIESDVLAELIEDKYSRAEPAFLKLVGFYIDKSDSQLEEIVLQLFRFAQSHPEPEQWIRDCAAPYVHAANLGADNTEAQNERILAVGDAIRSELMLVKDMTAEGQRIAELTNGPAAYFDRFGWIASKVDEILEDDKTYDARGELLAALLEGWGKNPTVGKNDANEDLKTAGSKLLETVKKKLAAIQNSYFGSPLEEQYAELAECADVAGELADLALEYGERFRAEKIGRNIADFSDVAHMALKVLIRQDESGRFIKNEDGEYAYTAAADGLANGITEIIVDEYQDTNQLQEDIIKALSAERFGRPDVFMVGDVKQSIYGFRMACPELFTEKYNAYAEENENHCRILLNSNFRSRRGIINFVNYIFNQSMISDVGGIDYTDGHALEYGGLYPAMENEDVYVPEITFIRSNAHTGRTYEGAYIAQRIKELVGNLDVYDVEEECMRKCRYSDIAILTRVNDVPEIDEVLEAAMIPFTKSSRSGFFDAFEIKLLMNFLRIIDNPCQDIPFAAILNSPLAAVSANDLAKIKIAYDDIPFSLYKACTGYGEKPERLESFLGKLDEYRERSVYMGTCDLIDFVIRTSGLSEMVSAMPQGESRLLNLGKLKELARAFSSTSYGGLFNFIRYVDKIKEQDIDFSKAKPVGADAVSMMSIHTSKGLEYPVVFVADTGKDYNEKDCTASIILDRELGMGLELRNPAEREKKSTILKEAIKAKKLAAGRAEEMRLLYVALTRAREKLYITGSDKFDGNRFEKWCSKIYDRNVKFPRNDVLDCRSYLKLLGLCCIRHIDAQALYSQCGYGESNIPPAAFKNCSFLLELAEKIDVEEERADEILDAAVKYRQLEAKSEEKVRENTEEAKLLKEAIESVYPYKKATGTMVKIVASQLEKHDGYAPLDSLEKKRLFKFTDDETLLRGSERGSAYHRFFELIDYESLQPSDLKGQLKSMLETARDSGMISPEYAGAINIDDFVTFIEGSLGARMKAAALRGELRREQQFVMGVPSEDGDSQLIQGIIDAFFIEDGEAVLVDYKTDRIRDEAALKETYEGQQNAYAKAIEGALGLHVKEKILYSVELGHGINL